MRKTVLCAGLLVSLVLAGCSMRHPRPPAAIAPGNAATSYSSDEFDKDLQAYRAALDAQPPQLEKALQLRDVMIGRIIAHVQVNYKRYEESIFYNRALFDTGSDILGIAVTTAATISNGERVKSILAATATALTGSHLSISKNYFREKTTEILVTKMQAARESTRARITRNMLLPVSQYSIEAALSDLVDFFYAGTLQGALLALSQEVGEKAEQARSEVKAADKERVDTYLKRTSAQEVNQTDRLQSAIREIEKANNLQEARRILTEIGFPPLPSDTPEKIWAALKAKHEEAEDNSDLLTKLLKALKITP